MIEIVKPAQFNTIAWKNGQGETTELAISEGGDLHNFDWRLSIASVNNDGFFSNFNGYQRNLVLIEGQGISLQHDGKNTDILKQRLDIASFDGACETYGELLLGAIKDFNIITKKNKITPIVGCYVKPQQVTITRQPNSLCFAYSVTNEMVVETAEGGGVVAAGHLVKVPVVFGAQEEKAITISFTGSNMIIIQLENIC